jgi:DNA-binding transcriptional ArsR family regulator
MLEVLGAPFEVLAEPRRRAILDLLRRRPHLVGELTDELGISQPGVSKHLRVLREAGLVGVRVDAQRRWYELEVGPLRDLDAWLHPYRQLWDRALDDLEEHLDTMPDDDPADTEG